jgi:indole-3-glycerol phosphate synthase
MPATLDQIVATTRTALDARRAATSLADFQARIAGLPPTRGFARALRQAPKRPAVIAEIKQASPSGGLLRPDLDPLDVARTYEAAGASCLSVLTEEAHFQGHLGRLAEVRGVVSLPLLQKDFLVDPYQVYEARAAGADAILLIAAILDDAMLAELAALAAALGLDALLEVHDEAELERAVRVKTPMLGINNRNLATYVIDLATTGRLISVLGDRRGDRLLVGESGVRTHDDVRRLVDAGADAVLVGEAMMRQPDLGAAYRSLFGEPACDARA